MVIYVCIAGEGEIESVSRKANPILDLGHRVLDYVIRNKNKKSVKEKDDHKREMGLGVCPGVLEES